MNLTLRSSGPSKTAYTGFGGHIRVLGPMKKAVKIKMYTFSQAVPKGSLLVIISNIRLEIRDTSHIY